MLEDVRTHGFPNLKGRYFKEKERSSHTSSTTILNTFLVSLREGKGLLSCTSSSWGLRTAEGSPHLSPTWRTEGWATVVEQQVLQQGLCLTSVLPGECAMILNCDLLQEPHTPLPSVKNWRMRNHSLKQVFLAPVVFATTCLDPAK